MELTNKKLQNIDTPEIDVEQRHLDINSAVFTVEWSTDSKIHKLTKI